MRRNVTLLTATVAALALLPAAAPAQAAKPAKAAKPKITRVTPMRVDVGGTLVIRGKGFKARARANTLVFQGADGRTAFAKPRRASRTKLVVRVPGAVARLLAVSGGRQVPTRVRLRVLSGRFSSFTPRRLSPVVVSLTAGGPGGPGGGGAATTCKSDSDHDNDLLSNATELELGTDPCLKDTDGDGTEDGYEVQAAIDLNHYPASPPPPYPGKRPYPNALDPGDADLDYDGDGLFLVEEFQLWIAYSADGVKRAGRPTALFPLLYSDGLQESIAPAPAAPPDGSLYDWVLDIDENDTLSDDERDADADGLGNWDELRGRFTEEWWPAIHNGNIEPKESKYPAEHGDFLDNEDLPGRNAHTVPDMDGDGILDGFDDHDHDGVSNQFEIGRPADWESDAWVGPLDDPTAFGPNPWAYVNPFNPCKPFNSERCHDHPPIGYYTGDGAPPIGPDPPPGHPGAHPTTPDG
jgi:hypothetical protein